MGTFHTIFNLQYNDSGVSFFCKSRPAFQSAGFAEEASFTVPRRRSRGTQHTNCTVFQENGDVDTPTWGALGLGVKSGGPCGATTVVLAPWGHIYMAVFIILF